MVMESAKGGSVSNSEEVFNVMKPLMAGHPDVEVVYGIFLNPRNKILAIEKLSSGTITCSSLYPREIVKQMIKFRSSALILAHNHPSGDTEPSQADIQVTGHAFVALASIGAELHDHIIVGQSYLSLADKGYIKHFKEEYGRLVHGVG